MPISKRKNPKIIARNENIRKQWKVYVDKKHLNADYALKLLEAEFLPLEIPTLRLIVSETGFYKNY